MTKTREQTLYRFEELPESVQDNVRYHNSDLHQDVNMQTTEQIAGRLSELLGIDVKGDVLHPKQGIDLEWSLSSCQGDGVAYYGTLDTEKLVEALTKEDRSGGYIDDLTPVSTHVEAALPLLCQMAQHNVQIVSARNSWSNHYAHYNTMDFEVEANGCETLGPDHPDEFTKLAGDEPYAEDECTFEVITWDGDDKPVTEGWKDVVEMLRDFSRYLETFGYEWLEAENSTSALTYHFAGHWFDASGRFVDYDDEDEREAHYEAIEKAESERLKKEEADASSTGTPA